MNSARAVEGGRVAVTTAVAGTVLIAAGAFWLSFTALTDLARRSGIAAGQAWAWPLIVDGIIVVATVAVVALAGTRLTWYPWMLLIVGAGLSVTANSVHAMVTADADVPALLAAAVAAVPPLVLLAITHLTVVLTRHHTDTTSPLTASDDRDQPHTETPRFPAQPRPPAASVDTGAPVRGEVVALIRPSGSGHEEAAALRAEGWSNKSIARHLGVHPSTIGRWFTKQTTREPKPRTTHTPNRDLENGRPTNGH